MPKANEYSNVEYSFVCFSYGDYCSDIVDSRRVLFCGAPTRFVADGRVLTGVGFVVEKQRFAGSKRAEFRSRHRVLLGTCFDERDFNGVLRFIFRLAFRTCEIAQKPQTLTSFVKHRQPNRWFIRTCPNHAMTNLSRDMNIIADFEYSIFAFIFEA